MFNHAFYSSTDNACVNWNQHRYCISVKSLQCEWIIQSVYMEIFKPIKGGENLYIFFHISPFFLFALSLDPHLFSLLCQPLFDFISLSLFVLMIWCAGKEATCAKLTWDDISRFITAGSPGDQKTRLKGLFQSINWLTCLTQVCESFCISMQGPAWRENCSVAEIFENV